MKTLFLLLYKLIITLQMEADGSWDELIVCSRGVLNLNRLNEVQ